MPFPRRRPASWPRLIVDDDVTTGMLTMMTMIMPTMPPPTIIIMPIMTMAIMGMLTMAVSRVGLYP